MRVYIYGLGLAFALLAGGHPAGAQDKQAGYKFTKGELAKYEVVGSLEISLRGSHADFIQGGIDTPLKMYYKVNFENTVIEVAESDGSAQLERRARTVTANGEYQGQAWKYEYDRDKDKSKAAPEPGSMAGLFHEWATTPMAFNVSADGKYTPTNPNYDRLVMKAGMMYWPVKMDVKTWVTEEKIAVPVLHDKLAIEFKNDFTKSITRENRKLMVINTVPQLKGTPEKHEEQRGNLSGEITFTVEGNGCVVEFDTTNRRLHSVKLDLAIRLSGKSPVSGGGEGDVKGVATFKETQVYKD